MSELFSQPEYLHVLLNPILTHVLPVAAVGLLFAVILRSPAATKFGLLLVFISAAAVWPTVHYGHGGYDRVISMADSAGGDWLSIHMYRAENWEWVFYATAIVALASFVAALKWPKRLMHVGWLTTIVALFACATAVYVAYPAGKIRHREFRNGPPPAGELQKAQQAEQNE